MTDTTHPTHQPWCVEHTYSEGEWGYCSSGTQDIAGVLVDANDGSMSGVPEICIGTDGMTTTQARELARTIVVLCDTLDAVPGVSASLSQSRSWED